MTNERGFSIVEVLVAIIILTIGLLALAQSSGAVTTMIGRGKQDTRAAATAQQVLDLLRQNANATTPKCSGLAASGTRTSQGTTVAWTVTGSGDSRNVRLVVSYNIARRGVRTDTVRAVLGCI